MIDDDRRYIINSIQAERWLTNIPERYRNLVKLAAEWRDYNVYVGVPQQPTLPHSVGVYTREPQRDHGPFWAEYHKLKIEMEHTDE